MTSRLLGNVSRAVRVQGLVYICVYKCVSGLFIVMYFNSICHYPTSYKTGVNYTLVVLDCKHKSVIYG